MSEKKYLYRVAETLEGGGVVRAEVIGEYGSELRLLDACRGRIRIYRGSVDRELAASTCRPLFYTMRESAIKAHSQKADEAETKLTVGPMPHAYAESGAERERPMPWLLAMMILAGAWVVGWVVL